MQAMPSLTNHRPLTLTPTLCVSMFPKSTVCNVIVGLDFRLDTLVGIFTISFVCFFESPYHFPSNDLYSE